MAVDRRVQGVPMLVLANKQDSEGAERVEEIKEAFNRHVHKLNVSESAVLPISALQGCVRALLLPSDKHLADHSWRAGVG